MKTKFLKNYTSNVPPGKTIARIEKVLISCGVKSIEKEYDADATITAIRFRLQLAERELAVRLPADKHAAQSAMWLNYAGDEKLSTDGTEMLWPSHKKKTKKDFEQQAERTAWKIVQDWVEVQMSMIQLKQADPVEVFMAYVWDGRETFYQRLKSTGYRALISERSEVV